MISTQFISRCGAVFLVTMQLSACSYLIPPNPSAPRYNEVVGERHVPLLNAQSAAGMASDNSNLSANAAGFPPVDQTVRVQAEQEMAAASQPVTPVTSAPLPAPMSDARMVPVENQTVQAAPSFNVAGNHYPNLADVPPRPVITGDDSEAARLANVRAALEADRANANNAREQLAHDVAAEPSMLPPESTGTVPPPAPVSVAPVAPPAATMPAAPMPSFTPAPQSSNAPATIAPVPTPVFAPPPPPSNMSALPPAVIRPVSTPMVTANVSAPSAPSFSFAPAPAVTAVPPAPIVSASIAPPAPAPIVLRPPVGEMATATVPTPVFRVTPSQQWDAPQPVPPSAGGFDPMAGRITTASNQTMVYRSTGYLPDSRYSYER